MSKSKKKKGPGRPVSHPRSKAVAARNAKRRARYHAAQKGKAKKAVGRPKAAKRKARAKPVAKARKATPRAKGARGSKDLPGVVSASAIAKIVTQIDARLSTLGQRADTATAQMVIQIRAIDDKLTRLLEPASEAPTAASDGPSDPVPQVAMPTTEESSGAPLQ